MYSLCLWLYIFITMSYHQDATVVKIKLLNEMILNNNPKQKKWNVNDHNYIIITAIT